MYDLNTFFDFMVYGGEASEASSWAEKKDEKS